MSEEADLFDEEPSGFARWIAPALIISILLHVIFYMWARGFPFQPFSEAYYDEIVPRTFRVDRVEIDSKLLDQNAAEEVRQPTLPTAVELPKETVSAGSMEADIKMSPTVPQIQNPLLGDKPKIDSSSFQETVKSAEQNGAKTVANDPDSDLSEIIVPDPEVSGQPLLELAHADNQGGGAPNAVGPVAGGNTPGFSNLDTLLAQTGPLTDGTAPILMPSDLLFDYDSAAVRAQAVPSLEKLGMIVRRNPQATFTIEGHTDSFGDDAYNLRLSEQRAQSVKAWLVQVMQIDPARIATRGFGESHLIAPATGDIEQQQINRRVEIVIHANSGSH